MKDKASSMPSYFSPASMFFILAALFFNTMSAPVVKMTQNDEGGYDYNKWCVYFFSELFKLVVALGWCANAYAAGDKSVFERATSGDGRPSARAWAG